MTVREMRTTTIRRYGMVNVVKSGVETPPTTPVKSKITEKRSDMSISYHTTHVATVR